MVLYITKAWKESLSESNVYTFRTYSTYDSFGRIKEIIYPDADTVTYNYYLSGELKEVIRSPQLGIHNLAISICHLEMQEIFSLAR